MSSITTAYNYEANVTLVLEDGSEYDLLSSSFKYIIIDNDYDNKHMPVIYIELNINSKLYNIMEENMNTASINLNIFKYDKDDSNSVHKKYISGEFIYFIDSNQSYDTEMESETNPTDEESVGSNYKKGCLGLLQIESLNNNKILNNDIIKNSRLMSIVHKYTNHMNMIIEPFSDNPIIEQLIIPPEDSITKLLSFINDYSQFYKGKEYRYYRDYEMSYILSGDGNPVGESNSSYNTIIVKVSDKTIFDGKENGITIDSDNGAYIINVESSSTSMDINYTKEKSYNSIIAIDTYGNTKKVNLNIPKNKNSTEKILLKRMYNDNLDNVDAIKDGIDNSSVILSITKSEIDNSVLTPNKEFQVENINAYKQYNGRFLLSSKKEVFVPQEDGLFIGSTSFILRKVIE